MTDQPDATPTPRPRQAPPITYRSVEVEREITRRVRPGAPRGAGRPGIAARDAERYYALLAAELATLQFTPGEGAALCDALGGTLLEPSTMHLLWAEVATRADDLSHRWQIDAHALAQRLRVLTPGQCYALADAVERFWLHADGAATTERDTLLRQAGLLR